ncbi:tetratricopeptide repeat protein [uncultured Sphingomonas sp.]|uniref:DUF3857 domain-containing protein n=1 Tax=uncultured Sphingomonas sp. TaxID=158754 RepID=UPI0025929EC8|nr:tetratricopeptide repeat protein [uncultured Sphingomonas sp.]
MMTKWVVAALLASASMSAQAADKILYQPAPDWVKPAPAIDPARITADSPVLLMLDNQQRLQDGTVWAYTDTATRAATTELLGQLGTVSLTWQPAAGDLIVHRAEIIRGGDRIDLIKAGKGFSVIRREQKLEQRQLDGMLTATMAVEGLQVGDILHVVASITRKDGALGGQMQGFTPLAAAPLKIGFARARLLWPDKTAVRWKTYADGATPVETVAGGYHELTVPLPLPKPADLPSDAPARFRKLPVLEASSFGGWEDVSRVMAPLYATDGLIAPGGALAAEVAKIRAASPDPMLRTAAALRLVQDQIRYLFNGMDQGNYRPQTPAETWAARYGDCKAKTLLLLALLHGLGIEAEPVLANSQLGDLLPTRLPTPGAFDHVLVRATVGGQVLWLDGTDGGARLEDVTDTPPFRYVLPVRAAGSALIPLPMRAHARPDVELATELDESAGVDLPAPFKATVSVRGRIAQMIQAAQAQASKDDIATMTSTMLGKLIGSVTVVDRKLAYDPATGLATISATGIAYPEWKRRDQRFRSAIDHAISDFTFEPDRSRTTWRAIPAGLGDGFHYRTVTRIRLPAGGNGYALDGDQSFARPIIGATVTRTVKRDGAWLTVEDRTVSPGGEVAVEQIPAERAALAAAKGRLLSIVAPADLPSRYQRVQAARKLGGFAGLLALYDQAIADKPDEAGPLTERAWFREQIYDRPAAIADLGRALAISPTVDSYRWRARLFRDGGDNAKAFADLEAAHKLEPDSEAVIRQLALLRADTGQTDAALDLVQARIDAGGEDKARMMALKADVLARAGNKDAAIATIDQAVAASPGNPQLLNSRCWIKGTLDVALDTALKDCTRAIELSDSTYDALDSRAMVYFRMNRLDDALADLSAALDAEPDMAQSLYMRGVIASKQGHDGKADLLAARTLSPRIDDDYRRYGIVP